jgi:hypothetical protein
MNTIHLTLSKARDRVFHESDRFVLAIQMCLPVLPTRSGFGVVFAGGSVHGFAAVFADLDKPVFCDFGDDVAALGVYRGEEGAGWEDAGGDQILERWQLKWRDGGGQVFRKGVKSGS